MRRLLYILRKEFKQILRDRMIMQIILMVPIGQMIILPWVADMDVRNLNIAVVDLDKSSYSRLLVSKIDATHTFTIVDIPATYRDGARLIESGEADIVLTIPPGFERNLIRENREKLAVSADAINGVKAGLGTTFLNSIIMDFNAEVREQWADGQPVTSPVTITSSSWYNPTGSYKKFMVPAILVLLISVVGMSETSMNIVKEKEMGTIEQINVTPIKKWQFIVGKLAPFMVISLVLFTIGLIIMRILYGIQIEGSLITLYLATIIFVFSILGFGLAVSTVSSTQQQSMFISFFFLMIFILMSGLFTITESMPLGGRIVAEGIPITHYMRMVRSIVMKGSGFAELKMQFGYLLFFAVAINVVAIRFYRKHS